MKSWKIPAAILPKVQNSGSVFGHTKNSGRQSGCAEGQVRPALPAGIPIAAVLGDQQAALYGQGCYEAGTVKNTYGTGVLPCPEHGQEIDLFEEGFAFHSCQRRQGETGLRPGRIYFIAGAVVQWLRDQLGVIKDSGQTEKFIQGIRDTHGVYFVPAFVGLGAPYWDSDARGLICGLTRGANSRHIVRAALESMAYQTKDVFDLMQKESGRRIKALNVDGGACRNDFLMQFQADILGCRITRPKMIESTAQGAAYLAGVTIGWWSGKKIWPNCAKRNAPLSRRCPPAAAMNSTPDGNKRCEGVVIFRRGQPCAGPDLLGGHKGPPPRFCIFMQRDLSKFTHGTYDVLVIGGGINGAAIAHMAARNGLKVALP